MKVVNIKNDPYDIYIGRGSSFGNPYSDNPRSQALWIVDSREDSIRLHKQWVWNQPFLIKKIRKELKGKVLGCYCKPLDCHGDTLMEIANSPTIEWASLIREEQAKKYYSVLKEKINYEKKSHVIYPQEEDIFNALKKTPFENVKVVILGQDPYINGEAHGLSFSSKLNSIPPSLRNIFKEIKADLGIENSNPNLTSWAEQGVLLINATMTVNAGISNSHKDFGWQTFTDRIISSLNEKVSPVVFLLWGSFAQKKANLITNDKHHILKSSHPSGLSCHTPAPVPFIGSKHFSKTNDFLIENGLTPIVWKT